MGTLEKSQVSVISQIKNLYAQSAPDVNAGRNVTFTDADTQHYHWALGLNSEHLLRLHLFVEAMLLSDSSTLHIKMSSNHLALKPVKLGSKRFLKEVSSFEFVQRLSGIIL